LGLRLQRNDSRVPRFATPRLDEIGRDETCRSLVVPVDEHRHAVVFQVMTQALTSWLPLPQGAGIEPRRECLTVASQVLLSELPPGDALRACNGEQKACARELLLDPTADRGAAVGRGACRGRAVA